MGVQNFIPELWAKKILKELDKDQMIVKHCTTEWSGEITGVGSVVKINNLNRPTIGDYVPNVTVITPESLKDESRMLEITEAKFFAFELDNIDEKQATKGLMPEAMRLAIEELKDVSENFVADKFVEASNTVTEAALTSGNFFSTMMKAKRILMRNNVKNFSEVVLEITPEVFEKGVLADIVFNNQDNGEMIRQGTYSQRLGMPVFSSNNIDIVVTTDDIGQSNCVMRTKKAIAYAEQIMKTEKYKPESSFSEALKGLHVYGAKTVQPTQMVLLDLTTAAETVV